VTTEEIPKTKEEEIRSRRTFAIISHPDAGKTTLTEKLLLYSGMVRTAGMVRGRKNSKAASSDWMAMEQERGISITASAMQFHYKGAVFNVLDTPGHQDFSEDTYRTLTAADSAIMVIDAAKGVETQTRKLFAVCKMRGIPILTFINKMDLPSRDPLELMQEVEDVLGIRASAINWPIGYAKGFSGVVEIANKEITLFQRSEMGGSRRADATSYTLDQLKSEQVIEPELLTKLEEDLGLLAEAGNPFNKEEFLKGQLTPMFFGSAISNFGLEPFFDRFTELAPSPRALVALAPSGDEVEVDPVSQPFSAFVFKIQSNMNPKHRDSMAFLRVCSGLFEREMVVKHHRLNKDIRLARSYSLVARDRSTVDVAYPGDVIGAINPGTFAIGDTISLSGGFNFKPMPRFPPEVMAQIRPVDVLRRKSFEKGMLQLSHEGAIQVLRSFENPESAPFIAAVGRLQFDVLQFRLKEEYNVETHLDMMPYKYGAYVIGDPRTLKKTQSSYLATDSDGRVLVLYPNEWEKRFIEERSPEHKLVEFVQG
jgi:peptide chain release factor 3